MSCCDHITAADVVIITCTWQKFSPDHQSFTWRYFCHSHPVDNNANCKLISAVSCVTQCNFAKRVGCVVLRYDFPVSLSSIVLNCNVNPPFLLFFPGHWVLTFQIILGQKSHKLVILKRGWCILAIIHIYSNNKGYMRKINNGSKTELLRNKINLPNQS